MSASTIIELDPAPEIQSYYTYNGTVALCLLCNSRFEKRNKKRHERTAIHRAQLKFYNLPQPEEEDDPNSHNPEGSNNPEFMDRSA